MTQMIQKQVRCPNCDNNAWIEYFHVEYLDKPFWVSCGVPLSETEDDVLLARRRLMHSVFVCTECNQVIS